MSEEIKICKNCKNFRQHYSRISGMFIVPIGFGHCVEKRLRYKGKEISPETTNCNKWQPEAPAEEQLKCEFEILLTLSKRLNGVLFLIEEDLKKLPRD